MIFEKLRFHLKPSCSKRRPYPLPSEGGVRSSLNKECPIFASTMPMRRAAATTATRRSAALRRLRRMARVLARTDGRPSARPDQHDTVTEFCCHLLAASFLAASFLAASPLGRIPVTAGTPLRVQGSKRQASAKPRLFRELAQTRQCISRKCEASSAVLGFVSRLELSRIKDLG